MGPGETGDGYNINVTTAAPGVLLFSVHKKKVTVTSVKKYSLMA